MTIAITDVVLRDAHQSPFATRLRLDETCCRLPLSSTIGLRVAECWGGATLTPASASSAKTRGCACANSKAPCRRPPRCRCAARTCSVIATTPMMWWNASSNARKNGIDVFRVRCHERPAQYESRPGRRCAATAPTPKKHAELYHQPGARCRPAGFNGATVETGVDSIAIKDMSGILTPDGGV